MPHLPELNSIVITEYMQTCFCPLGDTCRPAGHGPGRMDEDAVWYVKQSTFLSTSTSLG